jgi:hypothetical protein
MMDRTYIISDYSIIRNNQVILGGNVLFELHESQVTSFFTAIYKRFNMNYQKFYKMDNLCKLGFLAAEVLLMGKDITQRYRGQQTGVILSNAASSIDTDRNHQLSINDRNNYFPSPSVFVYTLANIVIGEICIRHKFYGESTFFIERHFNTGRLYNYVKQLLDDCLIDCCICGWNEMDGKDYEAVLFLVEKSTSHNDGIAIFESGYMNNIYMHRS